MITRLTHSFIYVLNLQKAISFYTQKLGFSIRTDVLADGERWVTVSLPEDTTLQILLVPVEENTVFKISSGNKNAGVN